MRAGRRRHLARHDIDAQASVVAARLRAAIWHLQPSHRRSVGWRAAPPMPAAQAICRHFTATTIERLTPLIDPDHPTGLDYYPLARPGERFPINDPALPPRLDAAARPSRSASSRRCSKASPPSRRWAIAASRNLAPSALATIRTVGGGAANETWTAIRLKHARRSSTACRERACCGRHGATRLARHRCMRH